MDAEAPMQVFVNGEAREVAEDSALIKLIESLKLNAAAMVAELNGEIVPRFEYETRRLAAGDRLELIRLVGGG